MHTIRRHLGIFMLYMLPIGICAQTHDYSDCSSIVMDEPSLAHVNITGIEVLPTGKEDNLHAWLEYSDDKGVSFKKRVIVNAQGATSLRYPKKNLSVDFCEDEWIGKKTTGITIGNWIKQDAFHFKAGWLDSFRGGLAVATAYKFYDDITGDRPHVLERAGLTDYSSKALCHPDGFPCIVYLNGEFYGIYAWQLKKHRKNMGMEKDNPLQVWFQLETYTNSFSSGEVKWNDINIKNPKVVTEESKDIIRNFADYHNELTAMSHTMSDDGMRQEIAKRYDTASFIDFIIYAIITSNIDGTGKNAQLFTYDGTKWFVAPYDLDETFGISWIGTFIFPPEWSWISTRYDMENYTNSVPYYWIKTYYWQDIRDRYAALRRSGAISEEGLLRHLTDWNRRVGTDYYTLEYNKWSTCPSNGHPLYNGQWTLIEDWSDYYSLPSYDSGRAYSVGDCCTYNYRVWKATQPVKSIPPVAENGYTDTEERVRSWIKKRIELEDEYLGYCTTDDVPSTYPSKAKRPVTKRLINRNIIISAGEKNYHINGMQK